MVIRIYGLYESNNETPRYIGKTKMSLNRRLQGHLLEAKKSLSNTHKLSWIRSLLNKGEKPIIKLLEECDENCWEEKERYWIKNSIKLTNLTNGGDGGGVCYSPIARYSLNGILEKTYSSVQFACEDCKLARGVINSALQRNPKGGFGGNYLWAYIINEEKPNVMPYVSGCNTVTRIVDISTGDRFVGESLNDALSHFGLKLCGAVHTALKNGSLYKKRYSLVRLN